jgi:hypothetical protein
MLYKCESKIFLIISIGASIPAHILKAYTLVYQHRCFINSITPSIFRVAKMHGINRVDRGCKQRYFITDDRCGFLLQYNNIATQQHLKPATREQQWLNKSSGFNANGTFL